MPIIEGKYRFFLQYQSLWIMINLDHFAGAKAPLIQISYPSYTCVLEGIAQREQSWCSNSFMHFLVRLMFSMIWEVLTLAPLYNSESSPCSLALF